MNLMNWMFRRYLEQEMGGEGGGGGGAVGGAPSGGEGGGEPSGGGDPSGGAGEPSGGEPSGGSGEPGAGGEPSAPSSMLDAIEKGLKEIESGAGNGEPPAKKVENKKPEEGKKPEDTEDITKTPEGLHPKAAERFQKLVSKLKEAGQQIEQIQASARGSQDAAAALGRFIKETGATSEEFSSFGQYLRARNSGDRQTEYNILVGMMQDFQMRTGVSFDSLPNDADPLNHFPDLKQDVEQYKITREHALEIARGRQVQSNLNQQRQAQDGHQAGVRNWVAAKDHAVTEIQEWERSMAGSDPDYAEISALLKGDSNAMTWVVQNTPPNMWKTHMAMLYNQAKAARTKFAAPTGGGAAPRPLGGSAGKPQGSGKAPQSMFEAIFPNG